MHARHLHPMAHGLVCCLFAAATQAQTAEPAAPAADYTLTTNVGLFSQNIFRGVGYSQERPVLQGGADLAHASGLYLGIWGTQSSTKALNNATGEIDLYGGYASTVGDFSYDVGLLQFLFPGGSYNAAPDEDYDTLELYGSVGWKWLKLKYSRTLTDYFGFNDATFAPNGKGHSKGSQYLELNANVPLDYGISLEMHVGRQKVKHYDEYSFTDYRIGVGKDLGSGWLAKLGYVGTNADSTLYTIDGIDSGRGKWLASIARTF